MLCHLVGDIDRRVQRVEFDVELLHVEVLLFVLQSLDGVSVLVLRVLLLQVLLGVLGLLLLVFLQSKIKRVNNDGYGKIQITYGLFLLESGFALVSSGLILGDSLLTLVPEVSNVVPAVTDIVNSQFNGLGHPPVDAAKDDRVIVHLLFLHGFNVLLDKAQLLVTLVIRLGLPDGVVLSHALEKVLVD